MIGLIVYMVVFLLAFFVASFAVARCSSCDNPTDPDTFLLLVAVALAWPLTVPLTAAISLLFGVAMLAEKLTRGAK